MKFKWPYFGSAWHYSHVLEHAGSPTRTVCWHDLDPIQGQGHGAFELPTTSEAVHAGGDDRSPLTGLSGFSTVGSLRLILECTHHWECVQHETAMQLCCFHRCTFTVEPSFVICENLMFGRRSFKGFNPEIEVSREYDCVVLACCSYVILLKRHDI